MIASKASRRSRKDVMAGFNFVFYRSAYTNACVKSRKHAIWVQSDKYISRLARSRS